MLLALFGGTRTMAGGCWTLSTGPAATVRATIARLRKQQQGTLAGWGEKLFECFGVGMMSD